MQLTVINGSPRGKGSNTKILLSYFLHGFIQKKPHDFTLYYLNRIKDANDQRKLFRDAEVLFIAFPLYTDFMPAMVKEFIENLADEGGAHNKGKKLLFLVQSGFPEALHSYAVRDYLIKFSERMGCEYLGTIIRGRVEGIQTEPLWFSQGFLNKLKKLGALLAENGRLDERLLKELAKPEKLSRTWFFTLKVLTKLNLIDFYWNKMLKENKAMHKKHDRPYWPENP